MGAYDYYGQFCTCPPRRVYIGMRSRAGVETPSYPVTGYDVNISAMGTAVDKAAYINLWNADPDNAVIGKLFGSGGPFAFFILVNSGQTPPLYVLGDYGTAPVNIAPSSNAGSDQTINLPTSTATLSGSGIDPDGTIASYLWTKVSGPAGGTITSPSSASTGTTALQAGTYVFRLRVTDNEGSTGDDTVTITVNPAALAFITHPASQTITSGSNAEFTAEVVNYISPYTAKWYKNGALILTQAGKTSGTISASLAAVNGDTFYVVAEMPDTSFVISNTATVTVTAATATITYGYGPTDPFVNSSTAPTISNSATKSITHNSNYTFNLPAAAADNYWVVKEPITEPLKASWYHNTDNSGPIPGDVVRVWTVGSFRYYASVSEFVLTYTDSIQLLQ